MKKITRATQLSTAQYQLLEQIRKWGKAPCTNRNRKTYKKLMEYGLVNYDSSYDYVVFTPGGEKLEL